MGHELLQDLSRELALPPLGPMLFHLLMALVLGALVAHRPWRRLMRIRPPVREMVHAQILIALAGAVVVTVIGDSLARAFGLVGLGGFIRFRTGIRDPRDAAVFFLLIGLGMACGLGAVGVALVSAAVVAGVVMILDYSSRDGQDLPYLRITAVCTDPRGAAGPTLAALESLPIIVRGSSLKLDEKELRFDVENPSGVSPERMQQAILERAGPRVTTLSFEQLETLKGIRV